MGYTAYVLSLALITDHIQSAAMDLRTPEQTCSAERVHLSSYTRALWRKFPWSPISLSDTYTQLTQPIRTSIQMRTFRATFPGSSNRLLTTLVYSPLYLTGRETTGNTPRDDTTYLVIEDRSVSSSARSAAEATAVPISAQASQAAAPVPVTNGTPTASNKMDEDDFELIEPPTSNASEIPVPSSTSATGQSTNNQRYRSLAVRPAASVMPLLTNLLSPFVMGLTKSARAAASTTAEIPRPTVLPGTSLALTSLTFPLPNAPHPQVTLSIHFLPSPSAASIFLEGEMESEGDKEEMMGNLRAFLDGCLPEGNLGEKKYMSWEGEDSAWEGVERTRKVSHMLVRMLREGSLA